jgi:endogenous inhibitor of DNA gyrase (YacG/DUF329 family)
MMNGKPSPSLQSKKEPGCAFCQKLRRELDNPVCSTKTQKLDNKQWSSSLKNIYASRCLPGKFEKDIEAMAKQKKLKNIPEPLKSENE